jgi:hypothetical protein
MVNLWMLVYILIFAIRLETPDFQRDRGSAPHYVEFSHKADFLLKLK